jgi:hypothetical protein
MQFLGVDGIYAVEPILAENGISGITPFALQTECDARLVQEPPSS